MANRSAIEIAGGLSSVEPAALLGTIDPRNVNIGIDNPWYDEGLSDQETYNRKALPWAGAAYAVVGGSIVQVAGRPDALSGSEMESQYPNLAEVWTRFAAAQNNRDPNPGSLNALVADMRQVAQDIGNVGTINPEQGEGTSLRALKASASA